MADRTLGEVVEEFNAKLPGWWWSVKKTSEGVRAKCAPDGNGPDADLVSKSRIFDAGFRADLSKSATPAKALEAVTKKALAAKAKYAPPMTLDEAIAEFTAKLPGWWWYVGECSVSADASCGPNKGGPDAGLLKSKARIFTEGFSVDLRQPATTAEALMAVMREGLKAKAKARTSGKRLRCTTPTGQGQGNAPNIPPRGGRH